MNYEIGDTIKVYGRQDRTHFNGLTGNIIYNAGNTLGVEFEEKLQYGHNCGGRGETGHCYFIGKNNKETIIEKMHEETIFLDKNTLSQFLKCKAR